MTAGPWKGVIFDFHGVLTSPPLAGVDDYEAELGLPAGTLTQYMRGHPMVHQLERSEIEPREYWHHIRADVQEQHGIEIDLRRLVAEMDGAITITDEMVALVEDLRSTYRTAMLTNVGKRSSRVFHGDDFRDAFDVVVESAAEGLRKPEPAIYALAADSLGLPPEQCVFVDDWPENLPPAADLGMGTVAYTSPDQCARDLRALGLEW